MLKEFILVSAVVGASSLLWAKPAQMDGFPVDLKGRNATAGLIVSPLERGGEPHIITVANESVVVVDAKGNLRSGFPASPKSAATHGRLTFPSAATVCDLDQDGTNEIIIPGSDAQLYALRANGKSMPGFPVRLSGKSRSAVLCIVQQGKVQLIANTEAGKVQTVSAGGGVPKTFGKVGKGAESGVGAADLDGDRKLDFVVGGGDSRLYLLNAQGRVVEGFPYRMSFRTSGIPAIGDIDDDGRPDIVFGSQDFNIHAVDAGGKALPGFPFKTSYRVYAGPALADIDGDGSLDVVQGSGDGKAYVVSGTGKLLKGFPVKLDARITADAAVGDIDRDGFQEIAMVTQKGSLYLLNRRGKNYRNFPFRLGGKAEISPAMADLDGDGLPELIAQSSKGKLHVFRFKAKGKAKVARIAWGMSGHSPRRAARFGPNPGRFKALSFSSDSIRTRDRLEVKYTFFDVDGDAEKNTQVRWFLNGKHQPDYDNQRAIPAAQTKKHQKWRYTLQEGANFDAFGEGSVLSRIFKSSERKIVNTAPGAPKIIIRPERPSTTDTLRVEITTQAQDADQDSLQYRYLWLKKGRPERGLGGSASSVPPKFTKKGEEWNVVAVAYDGETEGATATTRVRIENTPPTAPVIAVSPTQPLAPSLVSINIQKPSLDPDQDRPTYEYRYWADGKILNLPRDSAQISVGSLRKHQKVRVQVTPLDDESRGAMSELSFEVGNSIPATPEIKIEPPKPGTQHALSFVVAKQIPDPDGDPIIYRHQWFRDGAEVTLGTIVPSAETKKGQKWRLQVTPFDGETAGKAATVETLVVNTPPKAPMVVLESYALTTDREIAPRILIPASDDDDDPVSLRYAWSKNGKKQRFSSDKTKLSAQETRKGERWTLEVTPHDGQQSGQSVTFSFEIENSPPSPPRISLNKSELTRQDRALVSIDKASTDLDLDRIVYRYRWYRDGVHVKSWPLTKKTLDPGEHKKGEHWRVEVAPFDGSAEGEKAIAELRVINHAPEVPLVSLTPLKPTTVDTFRCAASKPGRDADGDPLTYRTAWFVDGVQVFSDPRSEALPAVMTRKGQKVRCELRAHDGTTFSERARSPEVLVLNSPPTRPGLKITPENPTTGDDLECALRNLSTDADHDPVRYTYVWRVGRKIFRPKNANRPHIVPSEATKRGQRWRCEVRSSDGAHGLDDRQSAALEVKVQNTTPTSPRVQIVPENPIARDTLKCMIQEESKDADGDRIAYRFEWLRNGAVQPFAPTSAEIPRRLVKEGDRWVCRVTPRDKVADGNPGASSQVRVASRK